jgi:hypothetical protein
MKIGYTAMITQGEGVSRTLIIGRQILDGRPGSAPSEPVCWLKITRAAAAVSGVTVALTLMSAWFKAYGTRNRVRFFLHQNGNKGTSFHSPLAAEVVLNELVTGGTLLLPTG